MDSVQSEISFATNSVSKLRSQSIRHPEKFPSLLSIIPHQYSMQTSFRVPVRGKPTAEVNFQRSNVEESLGEH